MSKMSFSARVGNAAPPEVEAVVAEPITVQVPVTAKPVMVVPAPAAWTPVGQNATAKDAVGNAFGGTITAVNGDEVLIDIGGTAYPFPLQNVVMPQPPAPVVPVVTPAPVVPVVAPAPVVPVVTVPPMPTLPVPAPTSAPVATTGQTPLGGVSGEVLDTDYNWPRLNIVQAVGPLSANWAPGTVLYEKSLILASPVVDPATGQVDNSKPSQPGIGITVLNMRKQYRENLPYGRDEMPEVVDSVEEVTERDGTLQWVDDEPPSWVSVAHLLVLVAATNPVVAANFPFEFGGVKYGLALYSVQKTSYGVFKTVNSATRGRLRGGLHLGGWTMHVKREKAGKNFVWKPHFNPAGQHPPELVNWIAGLQS